LYLIKRKIKVLKNKNHPDYEFIREWMGGEFDPEYFNITEVNELLQEENYGCFDVLE